MREKIHWWWSGGIGSILFLIYLVFQAQTIYGGDAGDFASAIRTGGIPHPPGYPLYTLVGRLLVSIIPSGSLAWKIGLLSSSFTALSLMVLGNLLTSLTRSRRAATVSVFTLAYIYPVWLYAEVVEVFALNSFFLVMLLWLMYKWDETKRFSYLIAGCFVFGLSLSHHQSILFLLPAIGYAIYRNRTHVFTASPKKKAIKLLCVFLLGLLPYAYVLIAPRNAPASVNWQGPSTVKNILQLVFRVGYGTFQAGGFVVHHPVLRGLGVWAFIRYVFEDFRLLGIGLIALGLVQLRKKTATGMRQVVFIAVCSYVFFLYYASFPLVQNFMVGTYERFLLPLYVLLTVFLCFGIADVEKFLKEREKRLKEGPKKNRKKRSVRIAIGVMHLAPLLFFLYPLGVFSISQKRIAPLRRDDTAEKLGRDILTSVPQNGVLLLSEDTALFNTQYVYYAENLRLDVRVIHTSKLNIGYYHDQLRAQYPDLQVPSLHAKLSQTVDELLTHQNADVAILSNVPLETETGVWVPWGVLYRLYPSDRIPEEDGVVEENQRLWKTYQDPLRGALASYQHLLLSDVVRIYADAHQEIGMFLAKRERNKEAEEHLLEAQRLLPDDTDSYLLLAQVYIQENRCDDAKNQIGEKLRRSDEPDAYYLLSLNAAACEKDELSAKKYLEIYREKTKKEETPLKTL